MSGIASNLSKEGSKLSGGLRQKGAGPSLNQIVFADLQERLNQWTFLERAVNPDYKPNYLVQDGLDGPNSRERIKEFQKANNLSVTGKFDVQTVEVLNNVELPPSLSARDTLSPAIQGSLRRFPIHREPRIEGENVSSIVLHDTAGPTVLSAVSHLGWATTHGNPLGYNFMIDRDGTVIELVRPTEATAHAVGGNRASISIAYVGGDKYGKINEHQIQSSENLILKLKEEFPTIQNVVGHKDVYSKENILSGKPDPEISEARFAQMLQATGLTRDADLLRNENKRFENPESLKVHAASALGPHTSP